MIKCEIRNKTYLYRYISSWVFFSCFFYFIIITNFILWWSLFFFGFVLGFFMGLLFVLFPFLFLCSFFSNSNMEALQHKLCSKIGQHFLVSIFQHDFETLGVTLKYDLWRTVGQCQGRRGGTQTPDPNKNLLYKDQKMVILSSRNRKK